MLSLHRHTCRALRLPRMLGARHSSVASASQSAQPIVIAVDGPAASGKGTLARQLAAKLGFSYLDTGLLYRVVAAKALERGVSLTDEAAAARVASTLQASDLPAPGTPAAVSLRSETVGNAASQVSVLPSVRVAVNRFPHTYVEQLPSQGIPGCVLDGRDVGTVMFPSAQVKIFLTASAEVRARRRLQELQERGETATYEDILKATQERDARDTQRATAPLKPAEDAHVLDSSVLSPEDVLQQVLELVGKRIAR